MFPPPPSKFFWAFGTSTAETPIFAYKISLQDAGLKEAAQRMLFTRDLKISNENSIEHRISSLPWKSEQVDFQFVSKLVSDILTQLQSSIGSSEALESAYFQCLFHLYAARESEAIQLIVDKSSRDTQLAHHLHQIAEKTIGAKQTDSYINAIGIRTFAGELKTVRIDLLHEEEISERTFWSCT